MKIAMVAGPYVPVPPTKYGGTERIIDYLIKGLKEAGHEPILIGPGDSTADCRIIPIVDKALYFPRHKKDLPAHERLVKEALHHTRQAVQELIREDIDIIHSHGYDLLPFSNFPNITTLHNHITLQDLPYYKARANLYYASISKNQQASYPELHYVDAIYNGEDTSAFPFVAEPEDYVCFLGRMDRDKSPHLAIQLAISLGIKIKLGAKLDLEGDGYFEEFVEPYFKHPLVEFLGEVGFDDKVRLISNAKCNLHPTNFREPFGLTVLEAAYCGTPTMAIARGSMPELIEDGRTGLLVEDFVEGRHHIEQCFAMNREYIASRARQLFNYQTMAKQYVNAYEKIITEMAPLRNTRRTILDVALDWALRLRGNRTIPMTPPTRPQHALLSGRR